MRYAHIPEANRRLKGGVIIKTYQDYKNAATTAESQAAFLKNVIEEYQTSDMYRNAATAQAYYARKNESIVNRMTWLQKAGATNANVKFFKMRNGFFSRMCKQTAGYLLGNGVTLDETVKSKLGVKFDIDFQLAGLQALIDGVNWCFWNVDRLNVFRATEFAPLFDEFTGALMAGVRFWRIGDAHDEKPLNVELFEDDGITRYQSQGRDGALQAVKTKRTYKVRKRRDALGEAVMGAENYLRIPIFPLYANELRTSELTEGLREDIDAYDFISSDLNDGITQIEGIYAVIKNYGGHDLRELLLELRQAKAMYAEENANADTSMQAIEIPHEAKSVALRLLEEKMYQDTMTLDIKSIRGGSLTNVAINVASTDFDLKVDLFEMQALDVIQNILALIGHENEAVTFKRRSLNNDTEVLDNLSTMLSDGAIDIQFYIEEAPMIPDEKQGELIARLAIAEQEDANEMFPPADKGEDEGIKEDE